MKKYICGSLLLALMISVLWGCCAAPQAEKVSPSAAATTAPDNTVHTVDEFLAALGSDREITLAPGTYDLTAASDYGKAAEGKPYTWDERTQSLQISNLQNLTIYGSDAKIILGKGPGGPLNFKDCVNLSLDHLKLSHGTAQDLDPELFYGEISTLNLRNCEDVRLEQITLQDRVPNLLSLAECKNVTVANSLFADSLGGAVSIAGCENVTVDTCQIQDIDHTLLNQEAIPGRPNFAALIGISEADNMASKNITIQNNTFRNNRTGLLAFVSTSRKVTLKNNLFTGNHMDEAAFCFWTTAPHVFDNTFVDNDPWLWYYSSSSLAVDEKGADLPEEGFHADAAIPQPGAQQEVRVSTAEEFLKAIGPDTRILLDPELLDLSTAPDYGTGKSDYYYWQEEYDGPSLVITGVNNLTIAADSEDRTVHTISAVPRYADVLSFEFCTNLTLENLTCGHTVEPGYCMGGVLRFKECSNITIRNCGLYGCGILGVIAHGGENLQVLDSDIYECSDGGVSLVDIQGVAIENTTFRDLGGDALNVRRCQNATMDGEPISQE